MNKSRAPVAALATTCSVGKALESHMRNISMTLTMLLYLDVFIIPSLVNIENLPSSSSMRVDNFLVTWIAESVFNALTLLSSFMKAVMVSGALFFSPAPGWFVVPVGIFIGDVGVRGAEARPAGRALGKVSKPPSLFMWAITMCLSSWSKLS